MSGMICNSGAGQLLDSGALQVGYAGDGCGCKCPTTLFLTTRNFTPAVCVPGTRPSLRNAIQISGYAAPGAKYQLAKVQDSVSGGVEFCTWQLLNSGSLGWNLTAAYWGQGAFTPDGSCGQPNLSAFTTRTDVDFIVSTRGGKVDSIAIRNDALAADWYGFNGLSTNIVGDGVWLPTIAGINPQGGYGVVSLTGEVLLTWN